MKQILDYDNYFIDENGNVFNSNTNHYLKGSIGENGYKYYRLSKNNHKTIYYAHRLVAEAYIDNPKGLPVVNHKDGNKLNNNIDNLEWVTYNENIQHWHNTIKKNDRRPIEYYKTDLPDEVWKEYKNYLISSMGRIRHKIKNNLLKPVITCGYYKVRLSNNGLAEDWMVHHLVYQVFFGDYDKTKIIDHIDGNKLNNNINNLRLVTNSENVMASLYKTQTNTNAKQVGQYDLNNNLLHVYQSCREAARILNLDSSTISKVCRGQNKTHGGFIFKYINK